MPADFDISPLIQPPAPVPGGPSVPAAPAAPPRMPSKPSSTRLLKWLILVAVGLFVVTVGSLWFNSNAFSDKGVIVALQAPDRATSGDELTYTVRYKNQTKVPLTNMSFRLFYPENSIVLKDGQTTAPESEGFTVDRLDPGQEGSKEFKIFVVGDKGAIKNARVHLIFNAGTLKSAFEKDASVATTITALPVTLTLVAPPTGTTGQPVQYILDIRNDTQSDLSGLKAVFTYPDGFTVQKFQPQPDKGNTVWTIDQLKANQGIRITVNGVLTGNERDTKTVSVVLQHQLNGQWVDYVRTEAFTVISSPLLSVTVSPLEGRDYVSYAGDTLRYTVTYANNSKYSLLGMLLGVKLEGTMYDFSRLQVINGFFDDSTKTVAWDSAGVPNFANLRPGQSGQLEFQVPLKPGFEGGGGAKNFFVKATAKFSTPNVPSGVEGSEVFALDSVVTKISSQPTLTQNLVYDDSNPSTAGPLPPQVGQKTMFTVKWQLSNPGNDIRGAKVTATLPPGVTWESGATANTGTNVPAFNASSNTVTWSVGTLPYGTGTGTDKYQAQFVVSIRPSVNQRGQSVPVVAGAALTGTDAFTGQTLQSTLRDFTTLNIDGHPNDGRVQ